MLKKKAPCDWVEECVREYVRKGYSRERAEQLCWGAYQKQESAGLCDFCDKTALIVGETIFGEPAKMCPEHYKTFGSGKGTKI